MRALLVPVVIAWGCSSSPADELDLPRTCVAPEADRSGTTTLDDALGRASVDLLDGCRRTYTLRSTANQRDNFPGPGREITELDSAPTVRTGHDLFDALHALALHEVRENAVDSISDYAFADGQSVPCPTGGCFETGRLWKYVWTRDIAYSVDLGLAGVDPRRARNSLEFKLSAPRDGGPEQIVQDTGTGGSYPVSSDRTTWALGASALLPQLGGAERDAFAARTYSALRATIEHDREVVFDPSDGLYTGEQSFLDWREQSYPAWTAGDVAPIASSKALGTNVAHLRAIELTATLAATHGEPTEAARYQGWADALRTRIRDRFWLEDAGLFSTFVTTFLDPAPARQFDLLGSALAVLSGVATPEQAARVLSSYPHMGPGSAPVIFPQQQLTPIYHNRAEWPFVTAYWLRAAAAVDHAEVATTAIRSLVRGAALNLSNMENLEIGTGAPWVADGPYSGPVVNSHRQLWSVAGYVSMVHHTLFGLRFAGDAVELAPYVPRALRSAMFARTDALVLNDLPWRDHTLTVVLHLPAPAGTLGASSGSYSVAAVRLNGRPITGPIEVAMLDPANRIDVDLVDPDAPSALATTRKDPTEWQQVFAPRVPVIGAVRRAGSAVAIDLDAEGEDTSSITYSIYRDGTRVAAGLAGTTNSYTDTADAGTTVCYAIETCFTATGNCSQRSRPGCWWGDNASAIVTVPASAFTATGGSATTNHGRFHYEAWGDAGHTLVVSGVAPARSGPQLVQLVYGNGGPISTGITCAVKRITIAETGTNQVIASGLVTMPHLGSWDRWADSTFMRATLDAAKTYRITIDSAPQTRNMSAFRHFESYVGAGGVTGAREHVNIAELKLLAR
jgi:hypothetical protein